MITPDLYCGLDIHKNKYVGCILDKEGNEIRSGEFVSTKEALTQFLTGIVNTSCTVIIENCGMWRYAHKIISELGFKVKLANGSKTKKIVGQKKTDYNDAKVLADLARTNYLDELYIPDEKIIQYRDLTHHLKSLREIKRLYKNKIKSELIKQGIKYQSKIWNIKGHAWLNILQISSISSLTRLLKELELEEKLVYKQVEVLAKQLKQTRLLMSIPGVGPYLSLVIYSELGTIKRFESAKKLVMYSGLCPGIYQTGETNYQVKNNACNKFLKFAFTIASGRATMITGTRFEKKYSKVKNKKGYATARRVIARDMAKIVWHMLSREESFNN